MFKDDKVKIVKPIREWTYTLLAKLPGAEDKNVKYWSILVRDTGLPWSSHHSFKVHDFAFDSRSRLLAVLYELRGQVRCDVLAAPQGAFIYADRDKNLLPMPQLQLEVGREEPALRAKSAKIMFRNGAPYVNVVASDDKKSSYVWQQDKEMWKRVTFLKKQPAKTTKSAESKKVVNQ